MFFAAERSLLVLRASTYHSHSEPVDVLWAGMCGYPPGPVARLSQMQTLLDRSW
jgi:hypothetical protein